MWAGRPAWYAAANGCWLKIARLAGRIEPDMREGTSVLRRVAGSNPARSTRISPHSLVLYQSSQDASLRHFLQRTPTKQWFQSVNPATAKSSRKLKAASKLKVKKAAEKA